MQLSPVGTVCIEHGQSMLEGIIGVDLKRFGAVTNKFQLSHFYMAI